MRRRSTRIPGPAAASATGSFRWIEMLNRRPFGRPEAAFYEYVAGDAVRSILAPELVAELASGALATVLDVGCGSGSLSRELRVPGRCVVGVDPSLPQMSRARRRHPEFLGAAAPAEGLPFATSSFDAVVSSCAIKHWSDGARGIGECARVTRPGGRLVVAEIDGGIAPDELLRFADRTRIPRLLRRLYPRLARSTFVPVSPTVETVAALLTGAGFTGVSHRRLDGLPFFLVTATRA